MLDEQVKRIESMEGILSDWSLPGELADAAAFDVARTVCRRAERCAARLSLEDPKLDPNILVYLNRLSDVLWLFGRLLEVRAGVHGGLRPKGAPGKGWSRPW